MNLADLKALYIHLAHLQNLCEFPRLNLSGDISCHTLESLDYGQRTPTGKWQSSVFWTVWAQDSQGSHLDKLDCAFFERTWSVLVLSEKLNTLHIQETYRTMQQCSLNLAASCFQQLLRLFLCPQNLVRFAIFVATTPDHPNIGSDVLRTRQRSSKPLKIAPSKDKLSTHQQNTIHKKCQMQPFGG